MFSTAVLFVSNAVFSISGHAQLSYIYSALRSTDVSLATRVDARKF